MSIMELLDIESVHVDLLNAGNELVTITIAAKTFRRLKRIAV